MQHDTWKQRLNRAWSRLAIRPDRQRSRGEHGRLVLESLEDRTVPATIVGWDTSPIPAAASSAGGFGASPYAAVLIDPSVTSVVGLTRGPGVTTSGTGGAAAWGGTNWAGATYAAGVTAGSYFTFGVTVAA